MRNQKSTGEWRRFINRASRGMYGPDAGRAARLVLAVTRSRDLRDYSSTRGQVLKIEEVELREIMLTCLDTLQGEHASFLPDLPDLRMWELLNEGCWMRRTMLGRANH